MNCYQFKIGSSEDDLRSLVEKGVPVPDRWTYKPYSRTEVAGDGTVLSFGFPVASWEWDILTHQQIRTLLAYIPEGRASGNVYISTLTDREMAVKTFRAIMGNILDGESKNLVSRTLVKPVYTDVTVSFTRLIPIEEN